MKTTIVLCAIAALTGCASTTGVVPMGKDTYMISRSDNSPAASLGALKVETLNEASVYCAKTGNTYAVVGGYDVPRSLGQFPQTEVQFRCVAR
jgi:putative hemolysin